MPLWLIQIVVGVVLSLASTLIQAALAPKSQEQQRVARGYRGTLQTGGKVPLSFLVGTIGVPGKAEYRNAWGNSGETPNAYLVDVISFGDLPISGFTGLFVNSAEVTVEGSGHVTQGFPVTDYDNGTDHLWVEFFDGAQTTANSYLEGVFGTDPDRPWLSDMIGRGVPYLTLTALINETLWPGWPAYMAVLEGLPQFDPRLSTAVGGSGSQVWGTQAGYTFSDNTAVVVYNILRGIYDPDGNHVWGGHARAAQVPYAVWAAAMDACDEAVSLDGGGTEKRFRCGREIFVSERPADVVRELLDGANMRLVYAAGVYYPLVGVPDSADFAFTDADVIVSEPTTLDALPALDDVVNGATATYLEPGQAWEGKETAPYYRSDLEAADDDRRQLVGLDLSTTFSGTQAQRILKATVEESRRFGRHVLPMRPVFGQYRPLQVGAWTSDANGYVSKLFLVTAKTEATSGNVIFGLQEIDPTDFDWTAGDDERPLSFAPTTPILPPAQPMAGFAVSPYVFPDATSAGRRAGILLEYSGALPDIRAVLYQVREDFGAGNTVAEGEITYDAVNPAAAQPIGGQWTLPATDYEVRAKFLPPDGSGRTTTFSSWLAVTTPDVALTEADLDASLQAMLTYFGVSIRDLSELSQLSTSGAADQDLANYADRIYVLNQQVVGDSTTYAAATEALLLALGVDGSTLADAISAIEAAAGDVTAGFLSRITASASPGGSWVRYGTQIRAAFGESFVTVSDYWEVNSVSGLSRRVMKASETYIVDDGDNVLALFKAGGVYLEIARIEDAAITNAKIGTAAITSAKIGSLEVERIKIADGAVTDLVASTDADGGTFSMGTDNTYAQKLSDISLTISDYPVTLAAFVRHTTNSLAAGSPSFGMRILDVSSGQVLLERALHVISTITPGFPYISALSGTVPLPPGSYTFRLEVRWFHGGGSHTYTTNVEGLSASVPRK